MLCLISKLKNTDTPLTVVARADINEYFVSEVQSLTGLTRT